MNSVSDRIASRVPMIVCLVVWLLVAGVVWLVGRGALAAAAVVCAPGPLPSMPVTMLVGLGCAATLAACWSLCAGLGIAAPVCLTALALALTALLCLRQPAEPAGRPSAGQILLGGLAVCLAAQQAAQPITLFDTGAYHVQAIRWIERYGIVPGLANLNYRLAFGDAWSVAQALFDPAPFGGPACFALNGLVFAAAVSFFLGGLGRGGDRLRLSDLLRLAGVPAACWLLRRSLPSASPDATAALFGWTAMILFVEKIEAGAAAEVDLAAFALTALAAFASQVKLSAAALLLLPGWLIWRNLRRGSPDGRAARRRRALLLAALAATTMAPFLARSYVLSGYLQFPVAPSRLPGADWAVPPARVADIRELIGNAARGALFQEHPQLSLAEWLPEWWRQSVTPVEKGMLAALPILALVHLLLALRRLRSAQIPVWPPEYWPVIGLPIACTLVGTLMWLLAAPDPRFGWTFFPFLALLLAAPLVIAPLRRLRPAWVALFLALVLLDQGRRALAVERLADRHALLLPAPLPAVATTQVAVGHLFVRVPAQGMQCWDAPLPCAPRVDPDLEARGDAIEDGFRARSAGSR
jgi:hypothetical protein